MFYVRYADKLSLSRTAQQPICSTTLRSTHTKAYEDYVKLSNSTSTTTAEEKMSKSVRHTQETLAESFRKHLPYDKVRKCWEDVTKAITDFIAKKTMAI